MLCQTLGQCVVVGMSRLSKHFLGLFSPRVQVVEDLLCGARQDNELFLDGLGSVRRDIGRRREDETLQTWALLCYLEDIETGSYVLGQQDIDG